MHLHNLPFILKDRFCLSETNDRKRVLIVGAGAVGSYLGGWLSHSGHDVVFADPWSENVETIRRYGIRVEGPHESFDAHPSAFHLHESQRLALDAEFDLAFIAVKAYDTPWAARFAKRYVSDNGYFVSAQNCIPDDDIAEAVGSPDRCVGLIMSSIAVRLARPGLSQRAGTKRRRDLGHVVFRAGEQNGEDSNRISELVSMLDPIDAGKTTLNLRGERWAKLCQNSMGNPVVGATMRGTATLSANPRARELQIRLASESAQVGIALGLDVVSFTGQPADKWANALTNGEVYEELDASIAKSAGGGSGEWFPSMGQDVQNGRPSEIDFMNGHVFRTADMLGVETPVTASIVRVMRSIDRGELSPDPSNVDLVLSYAGF